MSREVLKTDETKYRIPLQGVPSAHEIWVGFILIWAFRHLDKSCSPFCRIRDRFGQTLSLKIRVNPTQVQKQMGHPVSLTFSPKRVVVGCFLPLCINLSLGVSHSTSVLSFSSQEIISCVLSKAKFSLRCCVNAASNLLLEAGVSFTQPLRDKYALQSR